MDEMVKQCILSSESGISNDEESSYANKKMFYCVIATNSCLPPSFHHDELASGMKFTKREQIQQT